ncbi:MAG: helix-turn-helix domain-containing protein [Candidatus Woesearchaeota archaeon]
MIVKKEFLTKLKDFGLNGYEAKIWCALLSRGVSTAGELSDITAVPRSRSYDVLESLERKGFIITKLGKPLKYLAVPPSEVIERVKKNMKEEAERSIKLLDDAKESDLLTELGMLHSQGIESFDPEEMTAHIKSRNSIHSHADKMISKAQNDIVIACSANGLLDKFKTIGDSLKAAKKRGVSIKIILSDYDKSNSDKFNELKAIADIKHTPQNKHRFVIADDKEALLMLKEDSKIHPLYDTALWINAPFVISSLNSLVNGSWDKLEKI